MIVGSDCAGVIIAMGECAAAGHGLTVGDTVFGIANGSLGTAVVTSAGT